MFIPLWIVIPVAILLVSLTGLTIWALVVGRELIMAVWEVLFNK